MNIQEEYNKGQRDFSGADLSGADLSRINLCGVDLHEANLCGANLWGADLSEANLWGADLRRANLSEANLCVANLDGTNLEGGQLLWTIGNGHEIKTVILSEHHVSWTKDEMAIGCVQHSIEKWWGFDDSTISKMDRGALDWWRKWKPVLRQLIEMSQE